MVHRPRRGPRGSAAFRVRNDRVRNETSRPSHRVHSAASPALPYQRQRLARRRTLGPKAWSARPAEPRGHNICRRVQAPALALALEDATLTPALLSPLGPAELDIERTAIPVRATRTWLQVPRAPTFRPTYRERWHQQHQQVTCPFSPPRCLPCPSDRALHAPFRIAGSPGAAHGQLQRCRAGGRPHALFGNPLTPLP